MDPSDFLKDNDWVYNFSAEQRGVYWHLYVEVADAGGGVDYLIEEISVRCKAPPDVVDYIIRKKFYLVKHKGRNSKNKPLQIRHKTIDLKIKEAKKRVSDAQKAINKRWQNDTPVLPGEQRGNYYKNRIDNNRKEFLKKYNKKEISDFHKALKSWSVRRGIPPDSIPERECNQLLELLVQMPVDRICEMIESDVVAFTPKSLVVEWSKRQQPEKQSMAEQLRQYRQQNKRDRGADR